jgi:hypothetical protein
MKQSNLPFELYNTGQSTPRAVLDGSFATVTPVCYSNHDFVLFFLFISSESLKNHSKSQKIIK